MAKKVEEAGKTCGGCCGMCKKCFSTMMLVLGILVILNEMYGVVSWAMFIGVIFVLKGLLGFFAPQCKDCS